MKFTKILSIVLAFMMLFAFVSCGDEAANANDTSVDTSADTAVESAADTNAEVSEEDTIVMATNAAFPPYEFYEGETIVGIDAEIAAAIAAKLGKTLIIEDMEFSSIITAVQSGSVDFGMAGMTITEDRLLEVNFTYSYATGVQVVIVKDGSSIKTIDDLAGKKIGVQLGTSSDFIISDAINGYEDDNGNHVAGDFEGTGTTVSTYANPNLAAVNLEGDKLDAVVTDQLPAELIVNNSNGAYKCRWPCTDRA